MQVDKTHIQEGRDDKKKISLIEKIMTRNEIREFLGRTWSTRAQSLLLCKEVKKSLCPAVNSRIIMTLMTYTSYSVSTHKDTLKQIHAYIYIYMYICSSLLISNFKNKHTHAYI